MKPAIRIDGLAKQYRIGACPAENYRTLRETIVNTVTGPLRRLRQRRDGAGERDTFWALRDVSFDVRPGEVVGIVGRNGAGKSTLLKILSRITEPTRGRVEVRGRMGSLLEVGTGFHPELTGRENIFLNGSILGMPRREIERKFDEIVAFAEIDQFLDTPVKRYSSGMYVRLAFAVAAHLEPEILVIDEVLAVGDAAFQKKCLGKIGDVASHGRTVLFVSHNMAAVRRLCTRGVFLKKGLVQDMGDTERVISQYLAEGMEDVAAAVDLPSGQPGAPGEGTRLRFLAQDGQPQGLFRLGESWRIVLEFEMHRPTQQVIAAVGPMTMEGVPVITFWSKPKDLEPGKYQVEFLFDVPVSACDLQFAVGISTHERSFYYLPAVGHLTVTEVANGAQPLRAKGCGLIIGRQQADIEPVPTGAA
jgi:lipopolysaccharide transport system ATP-binding protein